MTHQEVAAAFIRREWVEEKDAHAMFTSKDGYRCFTFITCLAQWVNKRVMLINVTKYSHASTVHLKRLMESLPKHIKVIQVQDVPRSAYELTQYTKEHFTHTFK